MSRPEPIIFCELLPETRARIEAYAEALREQAPFIGDHGLDEADFWDSGIFRSAIERLRGQQAASLAQKQAFVKLVLDHARAQGAVAEWRFTGAAERHDYEVRMPSGRVAVIETKGCLDGNNTNIFERPPQADEFVVWSLCQNPGADPRHNAWSGIHTRLSAEIIHRRQGVDGVVIWDMVCGTGRPCPKLAAEPDRATPLGARRVPPPCVYLLPRSIPDPRNNPNPPTWRLEEQEFLHALWRTFKGDPSDITHVHIESRMSEADLQRRTSFRRLDQEVAASNWTTVRRARR